MLNMDLIGRTYYSNKVTALLTLLHVVLWITTLFFTEILMQNLKLIGLF